MSYLKELLKPRYDFVDILNGTELAKFIDAKNPDRDMALEPLRIEIANKAYACVANAACTKLSMDSHKDGWGGTLKEIGLSAPEGQEVHPAKTPWGELEVLVHRYGKTKSDYFAKDCDDQTIPGYVAHVVKSFGEHADLALDEKIVQAAKHTGRVR